ncbi:SGNH/GDSL hydrolase family protein [Massilia sp.]|uniref:SGNH/GDSL hydrolase family protein n=1 Tax=Massilia sp. TaxID=1882437 RepID=UPI00352F185E
MPSRRTFLHALPALAGCLTLPAVRAQSSSAWCATWGTAPAGPPPSASLQTFSNQTLRLIVHTSIPGNRVRVRLSNEMGSGPLRIGAAHIGVRSSGASLLAGSGRDLTFGGSPGATVAPGDPLVSDPVDFAVPALADLAVSLWLPGSTQATSIHDLALQTNYVSVAGNYAGANTLPVQRTLASWPFLTEVDVTSAAGTPSAIVALGDSLTDGVRSTSNANRRWTDYLARRLRTETLPGRPPVSVVNRGISANSLLTDYPTSLLSGRDALERFDRDVLATAGARWLFVLIGINDILYSSASSPVPAESLQAGWLQLIARARTRGMQVIGTTLPPYEGHAYFTTARDAVRQRANAWIRTSGAWDAVADFDAVLRDPGRPTRLLPAYDGGDHLHPNDAGYEAMAKAIPLGWFGV